MDARSAPLLTLDQVATALTVSRAHVYALMRRGKLVGARIGERWRFRPDAVEALIRAGERPGLIRSPGQCALET
jgi:excisionase family DNA binding protein